jgi:hypothetical protein
MYKDWHPDSEYKFVVAIKLDVVKYLESMFGIHI